MGSSWGYTEAERKGGPPRGELRMVIILIIFAVMLIVVCSSCTLSLGPTASEDIPLPTAPAGAEPGHQPLDMEVDESHQTCDAVVNGDTSVYEPGDWGVWCESVMMTLNTMADLSHLDHFDSCAAFWDTSDEQLLAEIAPELGRDAAIGFIDALWYDC